MNVNQITARLDDLSETMLAKGLREPRAQAWIRSHEQHLVSLDWKDARQAYGKACGYHHADTLEDAFDDAEASIREMPDADQRKLHEFMGALGKVIDLGRETGIEVGYVNPLVATMKRLSENVITFQPAALAKHEASL